MEKIFFEKQECRLCAQHALNMLVQQPMFTSVDLSEIAHQLDLEENAVLKRKNDKSNNMDDSGFFSVQVIVKALSTLELELVSIDHPTAAEFKDCPESANAFICNMQEHWFTLRKFGGRQWFSLNSVKAGPEVLSDTYLSTYISQLSLEGYSIFVIYGNIPVTEADYAIEKQPVVVKPVVPAPKEFKPMSGAGHKLGTSSDANSAETSLGTEDDELQRAILLSLGAEVPSEETKVSDAQDARSKRDLSRFM